MAVFFAEKKSGLDWPCVKSSQGEKHGIDWRNSGGEVEAKGSVVDAGIFVTTKNDHFFLGALG